MQLEADETLLHQIQALKNANSAAGTKVLRIGVGRDVPASAQARSEGLQWARVNGGYAAHWRVSSPQARALRVGIDPLVLPPRTELRFAGDDGAGTVYGPFAVSEIFAPGTTYWSPVLESETAIVEVFVPDGDAPGEVVMGVTRVSHLFASPRDADVERAAKIGESQSCERDLICLSATNAALASVGKAVARMTFVDSVTGQSLLCTGTLLNPRSGTLTPYFYSANHCIGNQATATTLTTHWFYDRASCGTGGVGSSYVQVAGGATLLYANATSDVLFLRLNSSPPAGAVYAGWDEATLAVNTATTAVHHPAGDVKKVSLGSFTRFSAYGGGVGSGTTHLFVMWNSTATGVTEGGSSGSGIFTAVGSPESEYRLRGGLHGGLSSCTATGAALSDYYSRFDQAYPSIAQYLDPTPACVSGLSATSQTTAAAAGSGSFGVTAAAGCAWTASSNASWLTTSSSGNGNGTVAFNVAANSGAARTGTITVGGQTFTVTQAAITHLLSVSSSGSGTGTIVSSPAGISCGPSCTASFDFGTDVTLTATASAGSILTSWNGFCSGTGSCQVTMSAARAVGAVFDVSTLPPNPPRLVNIATRMQVLTGDNVLIGGFIIGGSAAKTVVVRARGPSLTALGVPGALANPVLNLYSGQTVIASNDDWQTASNAATLQASGFAPSNAQEAAVYMTLSPGPYTAIVSGVGGTTGVGIIEVFEVDALTTPLINIATRGQVLTGDNVMIGGFIIQGSGPQTVVVRARGPSLTAAGVPNALANPTLSLYTGQTVIATNDDWQSATNAAALQASGFAPPNTNEAAILITLNPGAYTAIVSGIGGTTGVGIVEVFAVP